MKLFTLILFFLSINHSFGSESHNLKLIDDKCYKIQTTGDGSENKESVPYQNCKPKNIEKVFKKYDKPYYSRESGFKLGQCYLMGKTIENEIYKEPIKLSECKPKLTKKELIEFSENRPVCALTGENGYLEKIELEECKPEKTRFIFKRLRPLKIAYDCGWENNCPEDLNVWGSCYEEGLTENGKTYKANVSSKNCKIDPVKQRIDIINSSNCFLVGSNGYLEELSPTDCKPKDTTFIFTRYTKEDLEIIAANQKDPTKDIYIDLGKCEEVDTQTFGKLYKVETSLLNCRPENKAFKKGTYHPFSNRCFEFEVAKEYFNKDPENILTKVNESTAFDTIVTKLVTWLKSQEPQKSKKENIFINPSDPWIALIDSQNCINYKSTVDSNLNQKSISVSKEQDDNPEEKSPRVDKE